MSFFLIVFFFVVGIVDENDVCEFIGVMEVLMCCVMEEGVSFFEFVNVLFV